MKHETLVKCKADQPKIIPEKLKLWCTNHVKREGMQLGGVLKSGNLKMLQMV